MKKHTEIDTILNTIDVTERIKVNRYKKYKEIVEQSSNADLLEQREKLINVIQSSFEEAIKRMKV